MNSGKINRVQPQAFRKVIIGLFLLLTHCGKNAAVNEITEDKIEVGPNPVNLVMGGPPVQLSAVLKTRSGGAAPDSAFVWESEDAAIVSVDSKGLATGLKIGVVRVTARAGVISGSTILGVVSPNAGAAALTLSGHAAYQDRRFDKTGFTGAPEPVAIRNALVELVAIDGFKTIASGATNAFGDFTLSSNNASRRGGVYLRVLSAIDPAHPIKLEVRNNPDDEALLALSSPGFDDSGADSFSATPNLLAKTGGIGGGFNILDALQTAAAFVREAAPCPEPNPECALPLLRAYWEPGGKLGTYFRTPDNAIFICGGGESEDCRSTDPDEYDDSVIVHEFGHFVLHRFSRDRSPGGFHSLTENDQDIRLSWSEGWANFFSSAVRNSPLYVDTNSGGNLISFNLEDYSTHPNSTLNTLARYTTSEIAVAGVLWDSLDPMDIPAENDPLQISFREMLQVLNHIPLVSQTATMETFWRAFQAKLSDQLGGLHTVAKDRDMRFEQDAFEGNETALLLNDAANQRHTLYLNNAPFDEDIIPFKVNKGVAYTVRTTNLTNGADPLLTIREQNGTLVTENDNPGGLLYTTCANNFLTGLSACPRNGPNDLAAAVSFVWNGENGATLNAHVQPSPAAPPSAGRFGAYDIGFSSP